MEEKTTEWIRGAHGEETDEVVRSHNVHFPLLTCASAIVSIR